MKLTIIGAGAMGGAIAKGLLKQDMIDIDITVTARTEATLDGFTALGIRVSKNNAESANYADVVIIAVKPWLVEGVAREIEAVVKGKTVISVAAGVDIESMEKYFPGADVATAIPNIAAEFCMSMTFIASHSKSAISIATSVFSALGTTLEVDENHLSAGMIIASCGIAYALRYIRAATEGGVELGFKSSIAQDIVVQTVKGAAALLSQPGAHAEVEIDKVTTAGGITIRGLNEMEHAGFTSSVIRGIKASVK